MQSFNNLQNFASFFSETTMKSHPYNLYNFLIVRKYYKNLEGLTMKFNFDVDYVRSLFPATGDKIKGNPVAFLDGPGGSQVPKQVVDKISEYLYYHNANEHGLFKTSKKTENIVDEAREAFADFFGCSPNEIAFGANSTTNNFMLAHGLRRDINSGDEVIITDIDHICNRSPWKQLEEAGAIVKSVKVIPETCQLDFEDYKKKLSSKTKIVAINYASNATGTITDVKKYIDLAHEVGAITIIDAVHYAPHKPIDVKAIDTDILICSSYKFFGPQLGIAYIRESLFEKMKTIKVDADDILFAPVKFQTGTPNFEHISGAGEAVNFIAHIGEKFGDPFEDKVSNLKGRRKNIIKGMLAIDSYEEPLADRLRNELKQITGVKIYGVQEGMERTTTVSFTMEGKTAGEISAALAKEGIYTWDGDFYAITLVNDVFGLENRGGLLRIGFAPYNTMQDVERTIEVVKKLADAN